MLLFHSFLILFFSFLLGAQASALGWQIGLVLPCLMALCVFLSFERYLVLSLFFLFLTRWSPGLFSLELWLWIGTCSLAYLVRQALPLRSWTSVLVLTLLACGFWGLYSGSAWPAWEISLYLAVSVFWSILIFILFRKVLGHPTRPRTNLFFNRLP